MTSRPISPAEPTKKHPPPVQPNAHPYAIKTTSSALLSRSNSSPHSAHHARHHYVPSAPSRMTAASSVRHRYSSSLSSVEGGLRDGAHTVPALLPTPSSITGVSQDNASVSSKHASELKPTHRVRRAETMPPGSTTEPVARQHSCNQKYEYEESRPELYVGLPPNPKQWNTDELITYLETSLKSDNNTDGRKDDPNLVEILECVRACGLTGRGLLRLTDSDLVRTPLSDVQRVQLLERSRILRANVLRGRIYVDSYHSREVSDNSDDICSQSVRSSTPSHNLRGASMSADNLHLLLDSTGEDVFPPSPIMTLHHSDLISDASAQRYRDLARIRMRRRGRVKGLIETWERTSTSGSECSASEESISGSEAESESETNLEFESISDAKRSPESPSDLLSSTHDEPLHDVRSAMANSTVVPQGSPSLTPPPPYTHLRTTIGVTPDEDEEPSIEELLASSSAVSLRGARAWEADFGLGETMKRVPIPVSVDASEDPSAREPDKARSEHDSQHARGDSVRLKKSGARGSTRSRGKNARTQRVVTAIFTGSPSDDISNVGDETNLVEHHRRASGVTGIVSNEIPDSQDGSDSALRALEESIAAMRTQMDVFRLRLEEVEADTARREAEQVRYSDPSRSSEPELRQRRMQATEQTTNERAERPRGDTVADNFGNSEGWETMSLGDIAREVAARAIGWLFPYGRLSVSRREDEDQSHTRTGSHPGANNKSLSVTKNGRLRVARMSCSILLVSFAICAAVLRRMGFGRWARRP